MREQKGLLNCVKEEIQNMQKKLDRYEVKGCGMKLWMTPRNPC